MRRSERVVDESIVTLNQLLDEESIVGCFSRIETQVLNKFHLRDEFSQALTDRADRIGRVRLAVWSPQMSACGDRSALAQKPANRWQRGADPQVVADSAVGYRHIEIGPQQD